MATILDQIASIPNAATTTISQKARIDPEWSQAINFRPAAPGRILLHSVPSPNVAQTETGLLASASLWRPGLSTAAASLNFRSGSPAIGVVYTVTEADLAAPGDWLCLVTNNSLEPIHFSTGVTYPTPDNEPTPPVNHPARTQP